MVGGKRASGPPRRPRNPVAKAVRTPRFRPRVEQDKRRQARLEELVRTQDADGASPEAGQDASQHMEQGVEQDMQEGGQSADTGAGQA